MLEDVISAAQSWVGTTEQPAGSNIVPGITDWLDTEGALGEGYEWCAAAVSRWLSQGGEEDLYGVQFSNGAALTDDVADHFQDLGRFDMNPQAGDLVLYDKNASDSGVDHIGLVTGVNSDGTFNTIEGNVSDQVMEFSDLSMEEVAGFGHPVYDGDQPEPSPDPTPPELPEGHLLKYDGTPSYDEYAKQWQDRMADRGWDIGVDGLYGPQSKAVCEAFQEEKGLEVDGIVGPITWETAFRTDNVTP